MSSLAVREALKTAIILAIVVEPDGDAFHAYCPALKGLHVEGRTEREALNRATLAAKAFLRSLVEHGESLPRARIPRLKSGTKVHQVTLEWPTLPTSGASSRASRRAI